MMIMIVAIVTMAIVVAIVEGFVLACLPTPPPSVAGIAAAGGAAVAVAVAAAAATTSSSRSSAFHSRGSQFAGVPHQLRVSSNGATNPGTVVPVQTYIFF